MAAVSFYDMSDATHQKRQRMRNGDACLRRVRGDSGLDMAVESAT